MRTLASDALELMASTVRQPRWRVELYDILSGAPDLTLAQVIAGTYTLASLISTDHALDVTDYVADGVHWEAPGDKRADRLSFTLVDGTTRFHPDLGSAAKYFQIGQVVRLVEGDAALDESAWVVTFTGHIRGQVGFTADRQALRYETQVVAYGRRATPKYLKQKFTSATYGKRVEYADICRDVARDQMGLSLNELERFPQSLGKVTQFAANSIVDLAPLEALDKILETVGKVADFDGDGRLRAYSRDVRRGVDLALPDQARLFSYTVNQAEIEAFNSVSVTGLDKNITEVEQPEQVLGRATIPVGFWRPTHTVRVPWSENHSLRARRTQLRVLTSVNEALILDLGSEDYEELDEFEGEIRVDISDFLLVMIFLIAVEIGVTALVPDGVVVGGFFVGGGYTIPVGRVAEGVLMTTILMALATVSSGVYEIWGIPVIPVYKELTSVVTRSHVPDYLQHQKELTNDYLNTVEELTEVAVLELYWEVAQESPREVALLDDWRLEVGDILQVPVGGGIKLWVDSLSKTLGREHMPVLRVVGHKCPEGV